MIFVIGHDVITCVTFHFKAICRIIPLSQIGFHEPHVYLFQQFLDKQ